MDDPFAFRAKARERQNVSQRVRNAISERLTEVGCDAEASGAPVSLSSIRDFVAFIGRAQPARRPSVFLLENGNVRALWLNDKKEQVGLQFLGEEEVQFVIFALRPSLMARERGIESLAAMLSRVRSSGVAHLLG
jgi:hypothetical protein